jgi:hypothetical protein
MTQIPKRSLNPRIAPPRVLRRHAENELANLAMHARSAGPPSPPGPLLRDQLTMPAQDRVRCRQSRDVPQGSSADLVSEHSQPPTLIVGQSDAMAAQLRLENPILFAEEVDDTTLLSLDPTKERHEQKVEWEHASESIRIEVDGVSGHYGLDIAGTRPPFGGQSISDLPDVPITRHSRMTTE